VDSPTEAAHQLDAFGFLWRVAATLFFVFLNGFFVAAEFGLVKVRHAFIHARAREGNAAGRAAEKILQRLDHYLSACQLGITLASLALGALGEPAVAALMVAAAPGLGVEVDPDSALFHAVAFAIAFFVITLMHMTLGEQAPKIWALQRPEVSTMRSSIPLYWFSRTFTPFIMLVNRISNWLVKLVGIDAPNLEEGTQTAAELRESIIASARAGHISEPQWEIAERVLGLELGDADEDTIGGHVVARLERLPDLNEELVLGQYRVTSRRSRTGAWSSCASSAARRPRRCPGRPRRPRPPPRARSAPSPASAPGSANWNTF